MPHDTGLAALALLLESRGWRVALAGADTPIEEIDVTAEGYDCDLIALSATLTSQRYALSSYLSRRTSEVPVLVGGAAVRDVEDALRLGASGYARDLVEGVARAEELVGSEPPARDHPLHEEGRATGAPFFMQATTASIRGPPPPRSARDRRRRRPPASRPSPRRTSDPRRASRRWAR